MDMTTVKQLIIELKDSGLTFQEVADKLEEDYGVVKTRQAISGLYTRAKESLKNDAGYRKLACDVVNIYCLCDSAAQVAYEMQQLGQDIGYRKILDIVKQERNYVLSVQSTIVANLTNQLSSLIDIRDAEKTIEYKGVKVSEKRFMEYFEMASEHYIRQGILDELSKVYKLTSNKNMVRTIANRLNIALKTSDLK